VLSRLPRPWSWSRNGLNETTQARREQCVTPRSAQRLRAYAAYRTHVNLHSAIKHGKSANLYCYKTFLGLVSTLWLIFRVTEQSGRAALAQLHCRRRMRSVDRSHTVWRMAMFIDYYY
jgi:hypothetical protein